MLQLRSATKKKEGDKKNSSINTERKKGAIKKKNYLKNLGFLNSDFKYKKSKKNGMKKQEKPQKTTPKMG